MKNLARILSLLLLVAVTFSFSACDNGDDDEPDEAALQMEKLSKVWQATSVTYNGSDEYTDDYLGFELTISSSANNVLSYVVTGRPTGTLSPWNSSGTMTFGTPITSKLKRADGVDIDYVVTDNSLQMTMAAYPSDKGYPTRVGTVEGAWVFTFKLKP